MKRYFGDLRVVFRVSVAFAAIVGMVSSVPARAAGPTMEDALNRISAYAPEALAEQGAPGVSIAITDRTRTLRIITLGYSNLDARQAVTPQTRFPIGSITKGMTVTALMELHDEGRFDPSKPVQDYLPWFSIHSDGKTVYVHQLLSHIGGLPADYTFVPGYMFSVAMLRDAHTLFAPGTNWSYSNDGFATLGAILAKLDGRTWEQSVQARVFDALGMTRTSAVFTPQTLADTSDGYVFSDMNVLAPAHAQLISTYPGDFVDPAGTVISTPEDMARYVRFLLNGGVNDAGRRVLSASSYTSMTTPDDMNGKPAGSTQGPVLAEAPLLFQHYGYGLGLHEQDGDKYVAHTGGIAGYTACMEMNVTRGFGVIAMSNLVEDPLHPCAIVLYAMKVLRAQSLGQPLPAVPASQPMYLDRTVVTDAAKFAGTYTSPDGSQLAIAASGTGLGLQTPGGVKPLYPRDDNTFWVDDPRFAIYGLHFETDKGGRVTQITSGAQWFYNADYTGPKTFSVPDGSAAYVGRYESDQLWGQTSAVRVFPLKGKLTADGTPLVPRKEGGYMLGSSIVRFDTFAAQQAQRMWIDGIPYYRIDLP
jgi:CubicO group peptidase (beta-lactamase class C family)